MRFCLLGKFSDFRSPRHYFTAIVAAGLLGYCPLVFCGDECGQSERTPNCDLWHDRLIEEEGEEGDNARPVLLAKEGEGTKFCSLPRSPRLEKVPFVLPLSKEIPIIDRPTDRPTDRVDFDFA